MKQNKNDKSALLVLGLLGLCAGGVSSVQAAPKAGKVVAGIPFAQYGTGYQRHPDFASVDFDFPIPREALLKLKPEDLNGLRSEEFDQLYARLTSGPIPNGKFESHTFYLKGGAVRSIAEFVSLNKLNPVARKVANFLIQKSAEQDGLKKFSEMLLRDKVFDRQAGIVRNQLSTGAIALLATMGASPSGLFGSEAGRQRFPGKVFCGQSLFDSRRESVIIDYGYNKELPGYKENPDSWVSLDGFGVRDELRMVRPGFYIGKLFSNRIPLLNFAIYDSAQDSGAALVGAPVADACNSGYQRSKSSLAAPSEEFFVR